MAQPQTPPRELSPYLVLARFCIRIVILLAFAALGGVGFGTSLAALSAMSSVLCAVVALARREPAFSGTLNHWDRHARPVFTALRVPRDPISRL